MSGILEHRQSAGQDLEAKIFFVAQSIGAALDHSDLVVEPFDEAKRYFVFRFAVCGDAVPMTVDHVGELLIGLQPLPLERGAPVLEEAPRPPLTLIAPQL